MIRVVMVEDEPLARDLLRSFLALRTDVELVGEAGDGLTAVRLIDELTPDLVLLDINVPECTGLEVLRRTKRSPAVIFTTALDAYALTAFELGAFDYLLKPFLRDRFDVALDRAVRRLGAAESEPPARERIGESAGYLQRFFVRHLGQTLPVHVAEIVRLEADDDYTAVHAGGRRYLVHLPLREMERRLDPAVFLRVHRCSVVNLAQVRSVVQVDRRVSLEMVDGSRVVASRSHTAAVQGLRL